MKKKVIRSSVAAALVLIMMAGQFILPNTVYETEASNVIIANNESGIPDTKLYDAILSQADSNGDGILTEEEAAYTEKLQLNNMGIQNLDGMEYFIRLEEVDLSYNEITDVTPLNKTLMKSLNLSNNKISDITPLKDLNEIIYLDLTNNKISELPEDFGQWDSIQNILNYVCGHVYDVNGNCINSEYNYKNLKLSGNQISLDEAKAKLPSAVFYMTYSDVFGEIPGYFDWYEVQSFIKYVGDVQTAVLVFGDVDFNQEINLADAHKALSYALGIKMSVGLQFEAMDVDFNGSITLDDANQILKEALGIIEFEKAMAGKMDYIVENYLDIGIETDKEVYAVGDVIELTACAVNTCSVPIPVRSGNVYYEDSCFIECNLVDENGNNIQSENEGIPVQPMEYFGDMEMGKIVKAKRSLHISEGLTVEEVEATNYYIEVSVQYVKNKNSNESCFFKVRFPIKIDVAVIE